MSTPRANTMSTQEHPSIQTPGFHLSLDVSESSLAVSASAHCETSRLRPLLAPFLVAVTLFSSAPTYIENIFPKSVTSQDDLGGVNNPLSPDARILRCLSEQEQNL